MHELDYSLIDEAKKEYRKRQDGVLRRLAMQYQAAQALSEVREVYIGIARRRRNKLKSYLEGKEIHCEGI